MPTRLPVLFYHTLTSMRWDCWAGGWQCLIMMVSLSVREELSLSSLSWSSYLNSCRIWFHFSSTRTGFFPNIWEYCELEAFISISVTRPSLHVWRKISFPLIHYFSVCIIIRLANIFLGCFDLRSQMGLIFNFPFLCCYDCGEARESCLCYLV